MARLADRSRSVLAEAGGCSIWSVCDICRSQPAGNLSYGQRRLLEIVSSLITRPRLLLLDEPASGINPTLLNIAA